MKQKLRLRDCYIKNSRTFTFPKKASISLLAVLKSMCLYARAQAPALFRPGRASGLWLCLLMTCCAIATTYAQVRPRGMDAYPEWQSQATTGPAATDTTITPLQIGDNIPEALWHLPLQVINHPDGKETITLDDYRGKLILLDFWARGCGSCIAAFPKLDTLQQQLHTNAQIILVTSGSREKIVPYLQHRPLPENLFTIVGTKIPKSYFKHFTIPHYAWISREGYLMATTGTNQVSGTNLRAALSDKTEGLVMKRDLNPQHPFFLSEKLVSLPQHYSLLYQGFYPGLASQIKERYSGDVLVGRSYANYALLDMYRLVTRPLLEQLGIAYNEQRYTLQVADSTHWQKTQQTMRTNPIEIYSFEYISTRQRAEELNAQILQALNDATGYHGKIVHTPEPHLVITDY